MLTNECNVLANKCTAFGDKLCLVFSEICIRSIQKVCSICFCSPEMVTLLYHRAWTLVWFIWCGCDVVFRISNKLASELLDSQIYRLKKKSATIIRTGVTVPNVQKCIMVETLTSFHSYAVHRRYHFNGAFPVRRSCIQFPWILISLVPLSVPLLWWNFRNFEFVEF